MNTNKICGLIIALSLAAVSARADSLELKNGSLIKGKFMGGTQTSITFQVGSSVQSYDVADIRSLRFDSEAQGASPSIPSKQPSAPSATEQDEVAKSVPSMTIPAGTRISIRTIDSIDSTKNRVGQSLSGVTRISTVGRRHGGSTEGRGCLWPVGRVQRDRNFHWKVRTKTRVDGNRRPWPNGAASHRRIRSLRQVEGREYREKNCGGSRHWEHHRCACRRRERGGHRGGCRGRSGGWLGNYHQG